MLPGESELRPDPSVAGRERQAAEFIATIDAGRLAEAGIWIEDKGPITPSTCAASPTRRGPRRSPERSPRRRSAPGSTPAGDARCWSCGRSAAAARTRRSPRCWPPTTSTGSTYAGDDRTDVDAFRRIGELREAGELIAAVRVGVLSAEGPAEIAEEADITVAGPAGWLEMLAWLAGAE